MKHPKNCKKCGGKMQVGGVYRTQEEVNAANMQAKNFALQNKMLSGEDAYVATKPGDPMVQYYDQSGRNITGMPAPLSKKSMTIPNNIGYMDIQSEGNNYWYNDPQSGDLVDVDFSVLNSPRLMRERDNLMARGVLPSSAAKSIVGTNPLASPAPMAIRMKGGKVMQTGGQPRQQDYPDYESWVAAMEQYQGMSGQSPYFDISSMMPPKYVNEGDVPSPEPLQDDTDRVQEGISKGIIEAPKGYNSAQEWYDYMNSPAAAKRQPSTPKNWRRNLGMGLMALRTLGSEISGRVARGRQNQYDYMQQTALGMMNPMPTDDYQPNPYSLYAKYGGKLRKGGSRPTPYSGQSIVEYLNTAGDDASFGNRTGIFNEYFAGEKYRGTAEQNLRLLSTLRGDTPNNPAAPAPTPKAARVTKTVTAPPAIRASASASFGNKPAVTNGKSAARTDGFENDRQRFFATQAAMSSPDGRFVMTDKGTNRTYYGTYNKDTGTFDMNNFEVLTGENRGQLLDGRKTLSQMEKMTEKERKQYKVTPVGFYDLETSPSIYGAPGMFQLGTQNAYHVTYKGADDMTRDKRYNNKNPKDNYISYGCINCQKPSIEALTKFVGDKPMRSLTIDSGRMYKENADAIKSNSPKTYADLKLQFKYGGLQHHNYFGPPFSNGAEYKFSDAERYDKTIVSRKLVPSLFLRGFIKKKR